MPLLRIAVHRPRETGRHFARTALGVHSALALLHLALPMPRGAKPKLRNTVFRHCRVTLRLASPWPCLTALHHRVAMRYSANALHRATLP
jgi:hypothetical protein